MTRRVVTGLDRDGRSTIMIEGDVPRFNGSNLSVVWKSDGPVADNSGRTDASVPYGIHLIHAGGTNFVTCEFPPGNDAFLHTTDTLDYMVVISGRMTVVAETGEAEVGPGDMVVSRGVPKAWRNEGPESCLCAVVTIPALPVGAGRTI